jgi:hypothetical protein
MSDDRVITYTTAPEAYDWFGTRTVRIAGCTSGKVVRMVSSRPAHVEAQRDRYASGCHMAKDETDWLKLVGYKLAIPAEGPCGLCKLPRPLRADPYGGEPVCADCYVPQPAPKEAS